MREGRQPEGSCGLNRKKLNPAQARRIKARMLNKEDFSSADWNVLRDTQYLVGLGTLMAAASGLGTIKETIAVARGIIGNQSSTHSFIRDLSSTVEMEAAQTSV